MKNKILIIDDDQKLNKLLINYLDKYNFEVLTRTSPENALTDIKNFHPEIIILDIMLPVMSGFDVCKLIRKEYSIPIIMLTARGEVTDRVVGLELGADDYLPKPFEPRELVARIQSVIRRSKPQIHDSAIFGDLEINYKKHTAFLNGLELELTHMEFEMLSMFTKNPGIVLDRDTIFEHVKSLDSDTFDRSIDVMISRLRQKLNDDPKRPRFLKTVWGAGYKFIGS
ncbi:MAG: response regulator transcription factor [Spirochaetes bacterium]|nr:response regulator transcription factor [Spirochaetota bacterium]